MTKLLITGASSYVGARFYQDLSKDFDVVGTYCTTKLFPELVKLDITSQIDINSIVEAQKPDVIIHIAANASNQSVEDAPEQSEQLNLNGTKYLLDAANTIGAAFIYMSSFAAIQSTTLYARLKKQAEEYITQNAKVPYAILQPSLILGLSPNTENDRPFNRLLKDLRNHNSPTYDDSWKFQPTYIRHLIEVTKMVIERKLYGHILPIAVPTLQSRYSIAKDILSPFGIEVESEDLGKKADSLVDLSVLSELGLPEYEYSEMVEEILKELRGYISKV